MNVAVLISGRFYNAHKNKYFMNELKQLNPNHVFDVYCHIWTYDIKFDKKWHNDVTEICNNYKPYKYITENIDINKFKNTYEIQNYGRLMNIKQLDKIYDIYITIRPDITYLDLNLSKLTFNTNDIYCYRCPRYAFNICDDFADWALIYNNKQLDKISNALHGKIYIKSNEASLKNELVNNGLILNVIGTVDNEIQFEYAKYI